MEDDHPEHPGRPKVDLLGRPALLGKGEHWIPTTIFLAGIGTLIPTDQYETPYFRRTSTFRGFNNGFSSTNTSLMIAAVPAAVREHVRKLSQTPEYAIARRARNKIEALFSELRNQILLRKLRLRGLSRAGEQFILAATAQNIKRLVRFMSKSKEAAMA